MRISGRLVYQIVSFSPAAMRVCKFRKRGQKYRIVSWNTVPCEQGGESAALRKALDDNGGQISGCMILTGAMESGTFFSCPGAPLNVRAQRNALEFELPLHMLQVPPECIVQFARYQTQTQNQEQVETSDRLNVYAFDSIAINHLASFLTMAKVKADEFIYPLLGIRNDDPPVCLPEIESGFCWQRGEWIPFNGKAEECNKQWKTVLEKTFDFPAGKDFPVSDYLACLLVMRLVMDKGFAANEPSVRIMPPKLRPSRCRSQVIIMAFLLLVLGIGWAYRTGMKAYNQYQQYSVLVQERDAIRAKITKIKAELKKNEKQKAALEKNVTISAGDPMFLTKLYDLSMSLPEDCLVQTFRFNDGNLDLVIQTQNRDTNAITQRMHFPYWRIARIQQRITQSQENAISTITLSLVKNEVQQ
ncbi:MAG: hypothetical protein PUC15_04315 [Lentisphaeria bacterium]|nr:hypothetical protein [Lentisphaeria bacterium]